MSFVLLILYLNKFKFNLDSIELMFSLLRVDLVEPHSFYHTDR